MARYGRRSRRRGRQQTSRVNSTLIIGIVLVAVLAGYLTTRFVIYPLLLQQEPWFSQLSGEDDNNDGNTDGNTVQDQDQTQDSGGTDQNGVISDGLDIKTGEDDNGAGAGTEGTTAAAVEQPALSGYCIQFGSFSTRAAADNLVSQLSLSGVGAKVVEKDGAFKVIGELFSEKDQAAAAMEALDRSVFADVFVTSI